MLGFCSADKLLTSMFSRCNEIHKNIHTPTQNIFANCPSYSLVIRLKIELACVCDKTLISCNCFTPNEFKCLGQEQEALPV